jgi:hypothetical protein
MQKFEWNENKRIQNIKKHNIDFVDAMLVFDGRPVVSYPSDKNGEKRWVTISVIHEIEITTVWTSRDKNLIRIISMRRARDEERRKYREIFG